MFTEKICKKIHIVMLDEIRFEDVSDQFKSWLIDIKDLHGVYPPAGSSPARIADAMAGIIHFVKTPEELRDIPKKKTIKYKDVIHTDKKTVSKTGIWAISLVLLLIMALTGTSAWYIFNNIVEPPADEYIGDDPSYYKYEYGKDGAGYTITGRKLDIVTELRIPEEIYGKPVICVGDNAFSDCKNLTGVTVSPSVTDIGEKAFMGCTGLKQISIPDPIIKIGNSAFIN